MDVFFPDKYKVLLKSRVSLGLIVDQIMMECCERAYDENENKQSLWAHLKADDPDFDNTDVGTAKRMRFQDKINKMNSRSKILADYVRKEYSIEIRDKMYDKEDGHYILNNLDYLKIGHLAQVPDLQLIEAILSRRIVSDKYTAQVFQECSDNYEAEWRKLSVYEGKDELTRIINGLLKFELEWQCYFDFIYEVVCAMSKYNIKSIPDIKGRFTAFCYQPTIKPALSCDPSFSFLPEITVFSRAVKIRRLFINDIVRGRGNKYEFAQSLFLECVYWIAYFQAAILVEDMSLAEWFIKKTDKEDWVSVVDSYDINDAFVSEKHWTKQKVRYAKDIYGQMLFDYKK
ncbi:hypothetical protein [Butyrivibrio sp. AE3004]|uniref:hypothetical protein n=1 Tax=Butyrivibrio sp. AE3004 TaxID=1506994 RepID=UPI0012DBCD71|nr:hypothetical protein [Butyrivibrio sp. AE3004]